MACEAPVEVRFDRFAVPHVFAGSDADAWRAVGYLQARDRLWQMELYRRAASGRLSELLGEATVAIDQRFLTLGLRLAAEREWQRTPAGVRTAFENFAAGVNAAMPASRGERPLELQLLGVTPEPWTPIDSLAISKLFAWRLGENHRAELLRYALVQEMGPRALELFPGSPEWAPVILQRPVRASLGASGASGALGALGANSATYPAGLEWLSPDSHAMSNSWVVHGSRTASGRPILANDPHLAIEMPSVWWEAHVVSDSLNVAGVTIPGIPFVVIGHNARIGWGLTNVGPTCRTSSSSSSIRHGSAIEWARSGCRSRSGVTRFASAGATSLVIFEVRSTRHGPVRNADEWQEANAGDPPIPALSSVEGPAQLGETVLALKWHPVLEGNAAAAFDRWRGRPTGRRFVEAVRAFSAPAQNFVYADVDGNIGYAMSGLLPIRTGSDGSFPVPGAPRDADWQSFVDMTQLPAVVNPPSGQFVTANNDVDRGLPYLVTRDWVAPFRSQRITQLLGDRRGLDVAADAADPGRHHQLVGGSHSEIDRRARCDRRTTHVGSPRRWARRVAGVRGVRGGACGGGRSPTTCAPRSTIDFIDMRRTSGSRAFTALSVTRDRRGSTIGPRRTLLRHATISLGQAAADALAGLRARFGDPAGWRWDEAHAVKFSHPLSGGGRVLDWFFSRGPVPVGGDSMTVNKTTTDLRRPYATTDAASYRQILDVGAWDGSLGVNTTGQSGHPRSPHYFDQNGLWRQGRVSPAAVHARRS